MKKITKILAVAMTSGFLLVGCADDVDEDELPDIEEQEPIDEDLEEDTE